VQPFCGREKREWEGKSTEGRGERNGKRVVREGEGKEGKVEEKKRAGRKENGEGGRKNAAEEDLGQRR